MSEVKLEEKSPSHELLTRISTGAKIASWFLFRNFSYIWSVMSQPPLCSNTEGRSWLCKYFIGWCTACHRSGISCVTYVASHVVPKSFPGSFCWIALFQQLDSSLRTLSTCQNLSLSSLLALVASRLASGCGMHQATVTRTDCELPELKQQEQTLNDAHFR